ISKGERSSLCLEVLKDGLFSKKKIILLHVFLNTEKTDNIITKKKRCLSIKNNGKETPELTKKSENNDLRDTVCVANLTGSVICFVIVLLVVLVRLNQQRREISAVWKDHKTRKIAMSHIAFLLGSLLYVWIELLDSIACIKNRSMYDCGALVTIQMAGWLMARSGMYYWLVGRTHAILNKRVESEMKAWVHVIGKAIIALMLLFSFLVVVSIPVGRTHESNKGYCVNIVPFEYVNNNKKKGGGSTIPQKKKIVYVYTHIKKNVYVYGIECARGLFSYALGVVVVDEWKETKGHGSGVSQTGLGLIHQASHQKKTNEKEEQLLSVASSNCLMYSIAVSVVCFSLMYNANWGFIPACCCCCLREPILTLQNFKKLDGPFFFFYSLLLILLLLTSFFFDCQLEKKIRKLSDRWIEYICVPLDTCHFRRMCQNIPLLCKPQPQPDTTTTAAATVTTVTTVVLVALVAGDDQNKGEEESLNSEKELLLTTASTGTHSDKDKKKDKKEGTLSPKSRSVTEVKWLEEEYDEMVWEGKLDEIAEAIQQNTSFDLERLWGFFDTNQSGVIDSRKTLSKLVFSLFCVFAKRANKKSTLPKYHHLQYVIEPLVDEIRPLIGHGSNAASDASAVNGTNNMGDEKGQETISKQDFIDNIALYVRKAVEIRKSKMALSFKITPGGETPLSDLVKTAVQGDHTNDNNMVITDHAPTQTDIQYNTECSSFILSILFVYLLIF
ncbi:hypothetical protein RFI_04651, partial [Reticulomyxa filosa]